jgi:hypothetical protein
MQAFHLYINLWLKVTYIKTFPNRPLFWILQEQIMEIQKNQVSSAFRKIMEITLFWVSFTACFWIYLNCTYHKFSRTVLSLFPVLCLFGRDVTNHGFKGQSLAVVPCFTTIIWSRCHETWF